MIGTCLNQFYHLAKLLHASNFNNSFFSFYYKEMRSGCLTLRREYINLQRVDALIVLFNTLPFYSSSSTCIQSVSKEDKLQHVKWDTDVIVL
jgi:hypothetical protein